MQHGQRANELITINSLPSTSSIRWPGRELATTWRSSVAQHSELEPNEDY